MPQFHRAAFLLFGLACLSGGSLNAQNILCLQGKETKPDETCNVTVPPPGEPILIQVRIGTTPVPDAVINVKATPGPYFSKTSTDANGLAAVRLGRADDMVQGTVSVEIKAEKEGWAVIRNMVVKPAPSKTAVLEKLKTKATFGDNQAWYVSRQLPHQVRVNVNSISADSCGDAVVVFKALGEGTSSSPDSAHAELDGRQCYAATRWKLGPIVGDQYLRATLSGSSAAPQIFHATARSTPWLAAGLAWTGVTRFVRLTNTSQTLQVETKSTSTDTTFTTTKSVAKLDSVKAGGVFAPTIGINTPIFVGWSKIRASLSADAQNLSNNWFVGLSLPQLWDNLYQEDIGVDVQAVLQISRREIVTNPAACGADTKTCVSKVHTRPVGFGISVQLNGSGLLSTIVGLFPK